MESNRQAVLGHGFVELVDMMGDDKRIVDAARVSTKGYREQALGAKNARCASPSVLRRKVAELEERDKKLIHYLMKMNHSSPFEQVVFVFHIKMPIFVARQWIRHRTGRLNEISARYSELPKEYYVPEPERIQRQGKENRQGSGERFADDEARRVVSNMRAMGSDEMGHYQWCLEQGVARELARINLPLSTFTEWFWQMDLHNLFHFLELRLHEHAQWEIRQYAEVIAGMVKERVPVAFEAFEEYRLHAIRLSRTDTQYLAQVLGYVEKIPLGSHEQFDRLVKLSGATLSTPSSHWILET